MSPVLARRLAWSLVGVLGGLSLILALPERGDAPASTAATPGGEITSPQTRPDGARAAPSAAGAERTDPAASAAAPLMSAGMLALQRDSDLHALARELVPQAEAGDAEAQYSLALVLRECQFDVRRHPDRAEFDKFIESVPRRSGIDPVAYAEFQRSRFDACDGFRSDPVEAFGADVEWFERAATAGHPLARLERELRAPLEGRTSDSVALRDAARDALASRRPEAFLQLLELEFPEADAPEGRDATPNAVAWWLLACARGLPCGPEARWRREQVAFRGGQRTMLGWEDALLFDLPGHEREQARERAAELGRALDAGALEEILPLIVREPRP
jgi:TPR repeat protein